MNGLKEKLASEIPEWLIKSKGVYLVITNAKGEFLFVNIHYQETFLSSDPQKAKISFIDLISETEVKSVKKRLEQCFQSDFEIPLRLIIRNKIKDTGRYKSIKWECNLFKSQFTTEKLIIYIGHDLVAVEKESLANDHPEKTLNNLFDDLQIGVVVQAEDSSILLSNTKGEELLGLTKDQLYGRTVYDDKWNIVKSDGSPFPADELPTSRVISTNGYVRDVVMGVFNPELKRYVWLLVDASPQLDDQGNLIRVVTTFMDISQRKRQEEVLKDALKEKTTLLSEIHHRVKNNLAIVSGLLELQSMDMDYEDKLPLQRSINRIQSIAMVHELMYQTEKLSSVNIKNYLNQLIPAIQKALQTKNDVAINLDLEDYQLNINQAIPLGLLMNELLTNSFKYAFLKIFDGKIDISMKVAEKEELLTFVYKDNGPGFAQGEEFKSSPSLGLNLIYSQLEQLHAEYALDCKGKFELRFTFKISEKGPHSNI